MLIIPSLPFYVKEILLTSVKLKRIKTDLDLEVPLKSKSSLDIPLKASFFYYLNVILNVILNDEINR